MLSTYTSMFNLVSNYHLILPKIYLFVPFTPSSTYCNLNISEVDGKGAHFIFCLSRAKDSSMVDSGSVTYFTTCVIIIFNLYLWSDTHAFFALSR